MIAVIVCSVIALSSILYLIGWFLQCINKAQDIIDEGTSNE